MRLDIRILAIRQPCLDLDYLIMSLTHSTLQVSLDLPLPWQLLLMWVSISLSIVNQPQDAMQCCHEYHRSIIHGWKLTVQA